MLTKNSSASSVLAKTSGAYPFCQRLEISGKYYILLCEVYPESQSLVLILESVHDLIRCQREMTVRLFVQRGNRAIDLTRPAGHVTLGQRRVINGDE